MSSVSSFFTLSLFGGGGGGAPPTSAPVKIVGAGPGGGAGAVATWQQRAWMLRQPAPALPQPELRLRTLSREEFQADEGTRVDLLTFALCCHN